MSAYHGQITSGVFDVKYQGYDYVEDEDSSASDMFFASECISQPDQQSESLDLFGPV